MPIEGFLATTVDTTTETEETKSVTVSGALATSVDWDDALNDSSSTLYQSTAESAKTDLENLLTSSDDVQSATVTINGFEEASSSRKRRQATSSKATVNYSAVCTVPESKSTDDISSSVETAVTNADPTQFSSFDSFAGFSVSVEETTETTTQTLLTQDQTTLVTNADTTVKTTVDTTVVTTAGQTTAGQTTAGQSTAGQTTTRQVDETTTKEETEGTTTERQSETTPSGTTTEQATEQTTPAGNDEVTTVSSVVDEEAAEALGELADLASLGFSS